MSARKSISGPDGGAIGEGRASAALKAATRLTAPAAAAAIAATAFADASGVAAVGVGVGAAAGAAAAALFARRRAAPAPVVATEPVRETEAQEEAEAHARNSLGREIAEYLPSALFVFDARGRAIFANAAAAAEFGDNLSGRHYSLIFRAPAISDAFALTLDARAAAPAGATVAELEAPAEVAFTVYGQQERHLLAQIRAVPPELAPPWGGEVGLPADERQAAVLVLVQDVTRARRFERMHRDFVANASHELKTPLASIAGFVETLRGPAKDDAAAHERFLGIIAEQAERMKNLVEDLLSLNRIELKEHLPPRDEVDLAAALDAAAKAQGGPELLEWALPSDLPAARGDANELTLLFSNLISNALKYGGETRKPRLYAQERASGRPMIGVTIEDFGAGIPKEHIPRLSERFYRVESAATRGKSGTGLGLAIVKHVVSRHRGLLEIESEISRGSRFTVWLPQA